MTARGDAPEAGDPEVDATEADAAAADDPETRDPPAPHPVDLPDGRVWLRVADPDWTDPLDPRWAERAGGRWNAPGSFRTLYLNADVHTARLQLVALLRGSPVEVEDLADDAYVLAAATLPRDQTCADARTDAGLAALGLPASYPRDEAGRTVGHAVCQAVGGDVQARGLRGVLCRSATTTDGEGRELAWFPATSRSRAHPAWTAPRPLGAWRDAAGWEDLGLDEQPEMA